MSIKQIFDEIASEPGTNAKMDILRKYKDNEVLKRVLYLANSPRIKFHIKQIPQYTNIVHFDDDEFLSEALDNLKPLSERIITGYAALDHLHNILAKLGEDDSYIIERIIDKDCKIGMGSTNINKVIPDLIEETPYMGAKSFSKKLILALLATGKRIISQIKMDGRYGNAIISDGNVAFESRQGEDNYLEGALFLEELSKFPDCVLNGELTMDGIPRYESNGIISSLLSINGKKRKGENITKELKKFEQENEMTFEHALSLIRYTIWDTITLQEYAVAKSNTPYHVRLNLVETYISDNMPTMISLIESVHVKTYQDVMEHFQRVINMGLEGTVVKSLEDGWKDTKPVYQLKLKLEIEIDLRIIGFKYGTGKNAKVISTIECESEDKLLKTDPTGMKEVIMQWVTDNMSNLKGTILTMACSGISQNHLGEYSTAHPRVKHFRDDKTIANTLKEILEIEASAKAL